jgi:hypothetical protein
MDRKTLAHRRAEDLPATSVEIVCGVSQSNEQVSPRKKTFALASLLYQSIVASNTDLQTSRDRLHLQGGRRPSAPLPPSQLDHGLLQLEGATQKQR